MDDLVAWLGEQFDVDRSLALLACATGGEPDVLSDGETPIPWRADHAKVFVAGRRSVAETTSPNRAMHIAAQDPARVLREIDAKRRMVARIVNHATLMGWDEMHGDLLRSLAAVYDDRPGYQEKWRP